MAASIEVATYDPKKVNVIVGGRIITGFASDGVVTLTKNEDSVTTSVGAKGDVTYSENANESGTVALTLSSTSSSLAYLRSLDAKRKAVPVTISDVNDRDGFVMSESNCRVMKMPDTGRQKTEGSVTVNIRPKSLSERGYRKYMAKQKKVTIEGVEYTLQSVSPSWYFQTNDDCGMTTDNRRDTVKYLDTMFKNVIAAPAEVRQGGMEYFDEKEDVKTPEKLIKAIERFLRE